MALPLLAPLGAAALVAFGAGSPAGRAACAWPPPPDSRAGVSPPQARHIDENHTLQLSDAVHLNATNKDSAPPRAHWGGEESELSPAATNAKTKQLLTLGREMQGGGPSGRERISKRRT